ncbi:MAG: ATP synthase F0 subunit B [Clostridiaceae bacterium]|nr:ATP synthase F0 subunit B [Clostridiaceae bacterium]
MAREKRFRSAFMGGFRKSDVNIYVEKILKEFDEKLKNKDDEVAVLKSQNKDLKYKYEELLRKSDEVSESREKIANVLIQAQENAEKILEDARLEAMEEKRKLEETIESDKEKIVDIRTEIKQLKSQVVTVLQKFEEQLSELAEEEQAQMEEMAGEQAEDEAAAAAEQDPEADAVDSAAEQDQPSAPAEEYDFGFTRY